jgi:hypothetical protein
MTSQQTCPPWPHLGRNCLQHNLLLAVHNTPDDGFNGNLEENASFRL